MSPRPKRADKPVATQEPDLDEPDFNPTPLVVDDPAVETEDEDGFEDDLTDDDVETVKPEAALPVDDEDSEPDGAPAPLTPATAEFRCHDVNSNPTDCPTFTATPDPYDASAPILCPNCGSRFVGPTG